MLDVKAIGVAIQNKLRMALPAREFLHYKADAGMQVVRISTRAQVAGIAVAVALLGYTGAATTTLVAKSTTVAETTGEVEALRAELASLKQGVALTAARVEKRQELLAAIVSGEGDPVQLAALMPVAGESALASGASALLEPLAAAERRQLAFVGNATVAAEARFEKTSALLRKLGLRETRFLKQSAMGMGGPEESLANAEPQFKALFMSWQKLDMLEKGMSAIPSLKPVRNYTYTSGYGVRYDPFSGATAMHRGVDLAGPVGEPILAAADGIVVEAGYHAGGYGKYVEIDHGAGIVTRYGHMSRIAVKKGDVLKRGEEIGGMGSTGRSTGSHLHYEVLIDGAQVNPMPFLEASDYVLAVQDRTESKTALGGPAD